jgi:hypothetical protein
MSENNFLINNKDKFTEQIEKLHSCKNLETRFHIENE